MITLPPRRALAVVLLAAATGWLGWTGGHGNAFDVATIRYLGQLRNVAPSLTATAIALTWLGSAYVTLGGAAAVAIAQLARGQAVRAAWLMGTVSGGRLLADGLKLVVDRPRPHFAPYPVPVSSFSFPSGHSANSMVAFGALALLLSPPRWRTPLFIAAAMLAIAIGMTRPFLGVHWPSDVMAGWMLGGAVLLLAQPLLPTASRSEA